MGTIHKQTKMVGVPPYQASALLTQFLILFFLLIKEGVDLPVSLKHKNVHTKPGTKQTQLLILLHRN